MLYGPHGLGAIPDGPESNRVVPGSPTGCWPGPNTTRLVLQAGPGPFPTMPAHTRAELNSSGLVPTHLTRDKFSGLIISSIPPCAPQSAGWPPTCRYLSRFGNAPAALVQFGPERAAAADSVAACFYPFFSPGLRPSRPYPYLYVRQKYLARVFLRHPFPVTHC
jgi:hypothetical protein